MHGNDIMTERELWAKYDSRPGAIFRRFVKGDKNIFSPYFVEYGHSDANSDYIYEIAWGNGIFGGYVAGATIVHIDNGHMTDLGECFMHSNKNDAITEARFYANSLE